MAVSAISRFPNLNAFSLAVLRVLHNRRGDVVAHRDHPQGLDAFLSPRARRRTSLRLSLPRLRSLLECAFQSGAILALLAYTCMKVPDARLQIIFMPFFDFSAKQGIYGVLAIDILGLLLGWRIFDHAAHLGGSLFGM